MTSKILRSNNTPIANIKTVSYTEKISATVDLRPGCVSSAYIEVVVLDKASTAPSKGEALKYYQIVNGVETYIGTFYAEASVDSRSSYSFTAFDAVDKLNTDFSARLLAIQEDFPMELEDLVSEACTVAGVQLYTTNFPKHDLMIQSFYVDNITCRDILSYAAEIACRFVRCDSNEKLIFDWYATKQNYRIYPTTVNDAETKVAYRRSGLSYQGYSVSPVGSVAIRPLNTEDAAYIYPTVIPAVTATDPLSDGNVTLYNLTAADDGYGNITLSGNFTTTDTNGAVEITATGGGTSNTLVIANNILLTNASAATMNAVAEWIYSQMSTIPAYRPCRAELFPAENPFHAGDIVAVTDAQNVSFVMPIMAMTVQPSASIVEAFGNKTYDQDFGTDIEKQIANLSNSIVQIDRLKVGYAEIDEAIVDSLTANGINADWIDAGHISVDKIDFHDYFSGINIPDVNDPSSLLSGQSIVDGWIHSPNGLVISGDASNVPGRLFITYDAKMSASSFTAVNEVGQFVWDAPAYGYVDSNGVLYGATSAYDANGTQGYIQTVNTRCGGASWFSFYGPVNFRNIRVFSDTAESFSFGFGQTISLSSQGLQVGKFVVDRTGNVTANGAFTVTNGIKVNGYSRGVVGYVDDADARSSITLSSGGNYSITPPTLPIGAKLVSIAIIEYTSATGAFDVKPYGSNGTGAIIIGTPSITIDGLQLRFWYEVGV